MHFNYPVWSKWARLGVAWHGAHICPLRHSNRTRTDPQRHLGGHPSCSLGQAWLAKTMCAFLTCVIAHLLPGCPFPLLYYPSTHACPAADKANRKILLTAMVLHGAVASNCGVPFWSLLPAAAKAARMDGSWHFFAFYVTIQVVWPHDPYWSRPHLSGKANQRSGNTEGWRRAGCPVAATCVLWLTERPRQGLPWAHAMAVRHAGCAACAVGSHS